MSEHNSAFSKGLHNMIDSAHISTTSVQDIKGLDYDLSIITAHIKGQEGSITRHVLNCGNTVLNLTPELTYWLVRELGLIYTSFRIGASDPLPVVRDGLVTALLMDDELIQAELERQEIRETNAR